MGNACRVVVVVVVIAGCGSQGQPAPTGPLALRPPVFLDAARTGVDPSRAPRVRITHDPAPPPAALRGTVPDDAAARWHLARRADELGLDAATLASIELRLVHDTGRGPIVVKYGQRVDGIPVARTALAVVMTRGRELVAITGELAPVTAEARGFALSAADAIGRAIDDAGATPRALTAIADDTAGYARFTADDLAAPARARPVLFPLGGHLVAAYQAELAFATTPIAGYGHVIAADDGRVLYRASLVADATHTYRVWADPTTLRPLDGPVEDYTPHPTGLPDGYVPPFIAPNLITLDGLDTAPGGGTDPWLPAGATSTLDGNSIRAYADLGGGDGFDAGDITADPTGPATFDRTYDVAADPLASPNQSKAAIVQLFYTTNWLHDWWYDSGFTEAAGNGQANNYGRGGVGGDPVLAEAEDSSGIDNANMFTPADGASPRMQMYTWTPGPSGVAPDGTIDNEIVAHEFGHYLHHRLVDCGSQSCGAMSEGWGDFDAMLMTLRPGDDLDEVYGFGAYALPSFTPNAAYFGIRRYPYSRDFTRSPLTFRHMRSGEPLPAGAPYSDISFLQGADNWEFHDAGEIWCAMLFSGLADLLADTAGATPRYSFEEGRRRYADYVVAGMIAAPTEPDFTTQRDAILAAALAADPQDFAILAAGYAKRGFGTGAVSPDVDSFDGSGIVEDFSVRGRPRLVSATLVEDAGACDGDGIVDAGETGHLVVEIENVGAAQLVAPTVTASGPLGVQFPAGATATFADVPMFGTATASIPVALHEIAPTPIRLQLGLALGEPGSPLVVSDHATVDVNLDITPAASATDDVASPFPVWSSSGEWARVFAGTDARWSVAAPLGVADATLTSPDLAIAGAFSLAFDHRFRLDPGDGVVLELSTDGGGSWVDAATVATPGYTATLPTGTGNPLAGRAAWTGTSPGYPALTARTIDFGTALAGQTVVFRFRLGADASPGGTGFVADNLAVTGAGTPFPATTVDDASCLPGLRPIADAGPDATVPTDADVTLDGSASTDPDGTVTSYHWTQSAGVIVNMTGVNAAQAHFTAPPFATPQTVTFQLIVTDNDFRVSLPDTVAITIVPPGAPDAALPPDAMPPPDAAPVADAAPPPPDSEPRPDAGTPAVEGGGGCCQTGSGTGGAGALLLAAVVFVSLRRSSPCRRGTRRRRRP